MQNINIVHLLCRSATALAYAQKHDNKTRTLRRIIFIIL